MIISKINPNINCPKYELMMPFFNRTRLERIGVVGPEIGLLLGWSAGSGCDATNSRSLNQALLCKDKKKERAGGGFARSRSDALVSFFMREKRNRFEGECVAYVCVLFTDGVALYL